MRLPCIGGNRSNVPRAKARHCQQPDREHDNDEGKNGESVHTYLAVDDGA